MIALAKKLKEMDPSEWIPEGDEFKNVSEQEVKLVVITLAANCIYIHKKRTAEMTIREIAHSL